MVLISQGQGRNAIDNVHSVLGMGMRTGRVGQATLLPGALPPCHSSDTMQGPPCHSYYLEFLLPTYACKAGVLVKGHKQSKEFLDLAEKGDQANFISVALPSRQTHFYLDRLGLFKQLC